MGSSRSFSAILFPPPAIFLNITDATLAITEAKRARAEDQRADRSARRRPVAGLKTRVLYHDKKKRSCEILRGTLLFLRYLPFMGNVPRGTFSCEAGTPID